VGNKDGWSLLQSQDALRRFNSGLQRCQRILHRSDSESRWLEPCDDLGPARPVCEKPMYQGDVAGLRRGLRGGGAIEQRTGHAGGRHLHERAAIHQKAPTEVRFNCAIEQRARPVFAPAVLQYDGHFFVNRRRFYGTRPIWPRHNCAPQLNAFFEFPP
jgi:hypothetical protein